MDATHVGARLLGEVQEGTLEELLDALRGNVIGNASRRGNPHLPIAALSTIIGRYQRATQSAPPPLMSVSGRYLPFLYHIVATLISPPHNYTVVIVDTEGKFDVTRLVGSKPADREAHPATPGDLEHVHIYRPAERGPEHVKAVLGAADEFMLYGSHASRGREWWGTVVVGGTGGHVNAGWKGWLRVEKEDTGGFATGTNVEEAMRDRERRQAAADTAGWAASSPWGAYVWKGG